MTVHISEFVDHGDALTTVLVFVSVFLTHTCFLCRNLGFALAYYKAVLLYIKYKNPAAVDRVPATALHMFEMRKEC